METNLIALASTTVDATPAQVWDALVDPAAIQKYMFGTHVTSDWREGSPITWKGEWEGKPYEDKGTILQVQPKRRLQYTHFSPLSGLPDEPANYHTVTIDLSEDGKGTRVSLAQDKNANEKERDHSRKNWEMVLEGLKKHLES